MSAVEVFKGSTVYFVPEKLYPDKVEVDKLSEIDRSKFESLRSTGVIEIFQDFIDSRIVCRRTSPNHEGGVSILPSELRISNTYDGVFFYYDCPPDDNEGGYMVNARINSEGQLFVGGLLSSGRDEIIENLCQTLKTNKANQPEKPVIVQNSRFDFMGQDLA